VYTISTIIVAFLFVTPLISTVWWMVRNRSFLEGLPIILAWGLPITYGALMRMFYDLGDADTKLTLTIIGGIWVFSMIISILIGAKKERGRLGIVIGCIIPVFNIAIMLTRKSREEIRFEEEEKKARWKAQAEKNERERVARMKRQAEMLEQGQTERFKRGDEVYWKKGMKDDSLSQLKEPFIIMKEVSPEDRMVKIGAGLAYSSEIIAKDVDVGRLTKIKPIN
jgi:hypothetical protein